jgi:acetoacetyl-[acyl-carrier protein] synthase
MSNLPLIVGYGGINAAGRSIFDLSHQRMLFDSIDSDKQDEALQSLGHLMGTNEQRKNLKQNFA